MKVFERKEDLLSLYNAINHSSYQNPDELEITTLDNVLYMRMKHTSELILKLSDSFEKQENEPALECKARVININCGFNTEIMEKCPKLYEF